MEKRTKGRGSIASRILLPILTGITAFALCIVLSAFILIKTSNPITYIPVAACFVIAVTSFFTALSVSRVTPVHFIVAAIISALSVSALLLFSGIVFGDMSGIGFTAINCIMSLVFSFLGAKLGKPGTKKKKRHKI